MPLCAVQSRPRPRSRPGGAREDSAVIRALQRIEERTRRSFPAVPLADPPQDPTSQQPLLRIVVIWETCNVGHCEPGDRVAGSACRDPGRPGWSRAVAMAAAGRSAQRPARRTTRARRPAVAQVRGPRARAPLPSCVLRFGAASGPAGRAHGHRAHVRLQRDRRVARRSTCAAGARRPRGVRAAAARHPVVDLPSVVPACPAGARAGRVCRGRVGLRPDRHRLADAHRRRRRSTRRLRPSWRSTCSRPAASSRAGRVR
jgi:hypothetical protein